MVAVVVFVVVVGPVTHQCSEKPKNSIIHLLHPVLLLLFMPVIPLRVEGGCVHDGSGDFVMLWKNFRLLQLPDCCPRYHPRPTKSLNC
jgi:hypothetical protein